MNMSDNQSALKTMQHTEGEGETEAKGRRTLFVYDLYSIWMCKRVSNTKHPVNIFAKEFEMKPMWKYRIDGMRKATNKPKSFEKISIVQRKFPNQRQEIKRQLATRQIKRFSE